MDKIDRLEARAQALSQSSDKRRDHERDLMQSVDQLESELQALKASYKDLETESERLRVEKERMTTECDRLRTENKHLVDEKTRVTNEIQILNDDRANACQIRDRALSMSETLIARLERDMAAETDDDVGEVVELITDSNKKNTETAETLDTADETLEYLVPSEDQQLDSLPFKPASENKTTPTAEAFVAKTDEPEQNGEQVDGAGDVTRKLISRIRMGSKSN